MLSNKNMSLNPLPTKVLQCGAHSDLKIGASDLLAY